MYLIYAVIVFFISFSIWKLYFVLSTVRLHYFLDDSNDSSPLLYRSVARRKTDLMPTIPSPRDSNFGSRTSLHCHTPRTQGKRNLTEK